MKQNTCRFFQAFAILSAWVAVALLAGCTVTKFSTKNGDSFSRASFGSKTAVSELSVTGDTNGVRTFTMKGYASDQVQALQAVTEAAVSTAIKSVKP